MTRSTKRCSAPQVDGLESRLLMAANPAAAFSQHLALAIDVDGDQKAEIATLSRQGRHTAVNVYKTGENGIIAILIGLLLPAVQKARIASADFNGDGRDDLAVCGAVQNGRKADFVSFILLNNGNGGFTRSGVAGILPYIEQDNIAGGDFNGDGMGDLVELSRGKLHVLLGDGKGKFSNSGNVALPRPAGNRAAGVSGLGGAFPGFTGGVRVAVGDVNGDGLSDIITGFADGSVRVASTQRSTGDSGGPLSFNWSKPIHKMLAGNRSLAAGDFNGDGHDDIIAMGDGSVRIVDGTSNTLMFSEAKLPAVQKNSIVGDFDGDGRADLATFADGSVRFIHPTINP